MRKEVELSLKVVVSVLIGLEVSIPPNPYKQPLILGLVWGLVLTQVWASVLGMVWELVRALVLGWVLALVLALVPAHKALVPHARALDNASMRNFHETVGGLAVSSLHIFKPWSFKLANRQTFNLSNYQTFKLSHFRTQILKLSNSEYLR